MAAWRRHLAFWLVLSPQTLFYLFMFVTPVVGLFAVSLGETRGGDISFGLSPKHYVALVTDPFYRGVIGTTLTQGLWVLVICLVLGYPTAWVISRARLGLQGIALALLLVPLLTDTNVRTLGQVTLFSNQGLVNSLIQFLGLSDTPILFLGTHFGVNIALSQIYLPYMVLSTYAVLLALDTNVIHASHSLGARQVRTFFQVILPLSASGVLAGSVLVFVHAITAFVTPTLIGGARVLTVVQLLAQKVHSIEWAFSGATAILLLAMTLTAVLLFSRFATRGQGRIGRTVTAPSGVLREISSRRHFGAGLGRWLMRYLPEFPVPSFVLPVIAAVTFIFILSPLFMVGVAAVSTSRTLAFPPPGLTLDWFTGLPSRLGYWRSLETSIVIAVTVSLASVMVGLVGTLAVARQRLYEPETINNLFLSPLLIPNIALSVALLKFFQLLGVPLGLAVLMLAHVLVTLPYAIRTISASLYGLDWSLVEASYSLGSGKLRTFWKVILPLLKPSLMVAALYAAILSFVNVGMSLFLISPRATTLPLYLFSQVESGYETNYMAAFAVMLIAGSVVVTLTFHRLVGLRNFAAR